MGNASFCLWPQVRYHLAATTFAIASSPLPLGAGDQPCTIPESCYPQSQNPSSRGCRGARFCDCARLVFPHRAQSQNGSPPESQSPSSAPWPPPGNCDCVWCPRARACTITKTDAHESVRAQHRQVRGLSAPKQQARTPTMARSRHGLCGLCRPRARSFPFSRDFSRNVGRIGGGGTPIVGLWATPLLVYGRRVGKTLAATTFAIASSSCSSPSPSSQPLPLGLRHRGAQADDRRYQLEDFG